MSKEKENLRLSLRFYFLSVQKFSTKIILTDIGIQTFVQEDKNKKNKIVIIICEFREKHAYYILLKKKTKQNTIIKMLQIMK